MVTLKRIVDINGVQFYVRVTVEGKRVEIVWDKHARKWLIHQLLRIIFNTMLLPLLYTSAESANNACGVKLHRLRYENESDVVRHRERIRT